MQKSKLSPHLKPYRKELILGPLFKLIEAILELLLPTLVALIINHGVGNQDRPYVLKLGGIMLVMTICGYASALVCQYYAARASQGFGTSLRNALFRHISRFSYAELDRFGTSTLTNRLTNDVNQLQFAVAMLIRLVIRAPFICIGAIIMAMILDFRLSLVLLAATPIFGLLLYWIISRTSPLYRSYQRKLDRLAVILSENLSGVRVIRAFAKSREEKARFREASDDLTATAIRVGRLSALMNPITTLVVNAAIIAILWVGGWRIEGGSLSQGEIIAFINYVTQILLALIVVSNLVVIFTKAFSSAARVNEVLAAESSIKDFATTEDHNAVKRAAATDSQSSAVPAIEFENVSFGYNTTGEQALSKINVTIQKGQTVGLIGGTGSGKTTFINLIPRFYEATNGTVKVEGIPVQDYSLLELRKKVGLVPQRAVLFTGTIAENIRWGKEDATDEEVLQAARIAQADDFVQTMPEKYNSPVARGGLSLSGGQKQRLTIARAVISRPDILILDDSSSALDYATDAALRKAIREQSSGSTVLLVSQRVSSIQHADQILVFEEGRLVGIGKHEELLAMNDIYRDIAKSQLDAEEASNR
ncbi:ABC transporter ATP-binding protein [Gorillibacterium sp. CAU 1737]|uniref:ABC transporter ATP-binding protein n=1 Tax=Gorillibacterium sp. CAU 1737 TaxID=3140362 RepID=UPI0032607C97